MSQKKQQSKESPPVPAATTLKETITAGSNRQSAQEAVNSFDVLASGLPDDQARDAFTHLVATRGFKKKQDR
jgi:hypothetical protein